MNRNCWEIKRGCLCKGPGQAQCAQCEIYTGHRDDLTPLLEKAKENDDSAVSALIGLFQGYIFQIGKRFFLPGQTREDLVQEGLLGLYLAIRNYDEKREEVFEQHLSRCIRNQILSAVRRATQRKQKTLSGAMSLDDDENAPLAMRLCSPLALEDEVISRLALSEACNNETNGLSGLEQKIMMAHIKGYSHDEIGESLKMNSKQIENAIFRARRKFGKIKEQWLL